MIIRTTSVPWDTVVFHRHVRSAVDQDPESKLEYAYKNHIASKMRTEGFRFRPVFRDNKKEPSHNRCDYKWSVDVKDKQLKIEILL
jgi:hypothetical protein